MIRTFITSVRRTEQITRGVRQLTFGGGDLTSFVPAAADQFLYVLAPPPGRSELTIDAGFTWEQYATMPPDEQPVGAYYTVRRWRPEAAELDMLFVLHGDRGRRGCVGGRGRGGRPRRAVGPAFGVRPAGGHGLVPARRRRHRAARRGGDPRVAPGWYAGPHRRRGRRRGRPAAAPPASRASRCDGATATARRPATTTLLVDAVRSMAWPSGNAVRVGWRGEPLHHRRASSRAQRARLAA